MNEQDLKKAILEFIGSKTAFDEYKINEAIKSIKVRDLKDFNIEKRG